MIQVIEFSIAHNRRINFGHLIMEEIIKNPQSVRETYCLYPRFLQITLEHRLTEAQQGIYARSRLIEPSVISLRPAMVLLNNAHYPNVVLPARVTVFIQYFFNTLDLVVAAEQVGAGGDHEEGEDGDSDSSDAQPESLNLDQTGASSVQKTPETNTVEGEVAENRIHLLDKKLSIQFRVIFSTLISVSSLEVNIFPSYTLLSLLISLSLSLSPQWPS